MKWDFMMIQSLEGFMHDLYVSAYPLVSMFFPSSAPGKLRLSQFLLE